MLLSVILLLLRPALAYADEGWVISSFDADIAVQADGSLHITETIRVDFGSLQKHGIFRDVPVVYDYNPKQNRVYDLAVQSVTDVSGGRHKYQVSREGSFLRIKIGDPDVTISGKQDYVIRYTVRGALNGFADHDEVYWNVTGGNWPVAMERALATVALPGEGIQKVTCFQGGPGSTEPCRFSNTSRDARFETTRRLLEAQQLTAVVGFGKGLVPDPAPMLEAKPRAFEEYFDLTPLTVGGGLLLGLGVLSLLGAGWWQFGRDRRYTTIYYLTDNPAEETKPLLSSDPIVIEYQPPEGLRPAQMGLLLDERADTLDATATVIDLAVRGYLHITELKKEGVLGGLIGSSKDWKFERTSKDDGDLAPYEGKLLQGLFQEDNVAVLSDLKTKLHQYLTDSQKLLYADSRQRGWFPHRPDLARVFWRVVGIGVVVLGAFATYLLGATLGAGLVGLVIAAGGLITYLLAPVMPRRTASGRELLRRVLGFRQYLATAEKERLKFAEQQHLFAEYLPYAMVFSCVDKWARALRDIGMEPPSRDWYSGSTPLNTMDFSRNLQGFASEVSSVIVSTPGGSGGSGFSGGAGGGGGGGGGGSW